MIGAEFPGCAAASDPPFLNKPVSDDDDELSCDDDLLFLVPETASVSTLPTTRAVAETQTTPPHGAVTALFRPWS